MKNFIIASFVALNFTGCAFLNFGSSTEPCANMNAKKAKIASYERHSASSYRYKFLVDDDLCYANATKYYGNSGDVALISVKNSFASNVQIISKNIQAGTKESYTPTKIIKKKLNKNENITAPKEEAISF